MGATREYNQAYYRRNAEKLKAYTRAYYRRNRTKCIADTRARSNKIRDEKRALVDAAKNCPCTDCGQKFPTVCMDFDHPPGTKELAIASAVGDRTISVETLRREIAKCEVVCANCHRIRTHL